MPTLSPDGVPTITQWSGSPKLFGLKQVSSTLAKPSLWFQTQAITKSNTSNRWEKASKSVMAAATDPCAKLHHLDNQPADTSRSRLINASFQAQDQHEPKGAGVTSFLSEGPSSNLAKDKALVPPSDGIIWAIIPPLIHWSSMGRPIKSSYIKPSKMRLKVYNARAPMTGSCWSGWILAIPTSLRELNNYSLWNKPTQLKYSALYYRHQPSGLTEVLSTSATPSIEITASVLTMANMDSCTKLFTRNFFSER